jgi:LysW-gamma-L-lysine carboxypeptidase
VTEAVELLQALVATLSPSLQEGNASALLVQWMRDHGFESGVDEAGNAVGSRGTGPREILLLGHIDTFPGEVPVRIEEGKLYGRGTVDAKGPLAAFAVAASRARIPEGWRVTVVGAVEEEYWTSRGTRHVVETWGSRPLPVAVVVGEPSRWDRITLGYRGSVEVRVRVRVPFAHSAGQTPLPAERTVELWQAIQEFVTSRNEGRPGAEFERFSAALRSIRTKPVGTFGLGGLVVGLRLPPGARLPAVTQELQSHLTEQVEGWDADGAAVRLRFRGGQEAYKASKETPLVAAFLRAIRAEGGQPRFVTKTGTADLNVVGPVWPTVPMAVYGPGDSALDHTPDEHVIIEEYEQAIRVLVGMLDGLMSDSRYSK